MKSISLYVDKDTFLTRMHPFTKLCYILTAICLPLISGKPGMFAPVIFVSLALLISGKILNRIFPLIAFSFTIVITIFLIHGLFNAANQRVLFQIGGVKFYREGLLYASKIGLNILNMLLSFAVFVLTTKPSQLVDDLERIGFPPRFGYMLSSVFQILPQMAATMHTITDAQRSRGMETEGKLSVRIRAFIPLISPVVTSSLINTRERAIALEVRGFDSGVKKTFLTDHKLGRIDKALIALFICLLIGVAVRRVWNVIY